MNNLQRNDRRKTALILQRYAERDLVQTKKLINELVNELMCLQNPANSVEKEIQRYMRDSVVDCKKRIAHLKTAIRYMAMQ